MKYFFDNNISPKFAQMLRALGVDVVALREELEQDIDDCNLLRVLCGREVVFVTSDKSISRNPVEAAELKRANVTTLFLEPFFVKLQFWNQASWLVKNWPTIDGYASGTTKGTCACVKQNGKSQPFQI